MNSGKLHVFYTISYANFQGTARDTTCDFAQLIKIYAAPREGEQRCSPAEVV
jgi:hypothetical protein